MTDEQKSCIIQFRFEGMTYSEIAQKLNISINTVKSFHRRHAQTDMTKVQCKQCGKPITQSKRTREKKFCSDKCRMAWWKLHDDEMNKNAVYDFKCEICGKEFQAYGNNHRKYCSRGCYIKMRFGGADGE